VRKLRNLATARKLGLLVMALIVFNPIADTRAGELHSVRVETDVLYGTGVVQASSAPQKRSLYLDAYLPTGNAGKVGKATPAILVAFGGAYHQGDKGEHHFLEDGARDSSMADYCRALAARGTACFSIDYRLTQEDPAFPKGIRSDDLMPKKLLNSPLVTGRVELVRKRLGLAPLDAQTREQLWNSTFAAVEDMETALNFIRAKAQKYNLDTQRIALGGFSAGAMTAINLGYGKGADVVGVVAISGTSWGYNLPKTLRADAPPLLLFAGQWDLAGIRQGSGAIIRLFKAKGVPVSQAWVPGFGHFYPMQAPSLSSGFDRQSVLDRLNGFLQSQFENEGFFPARK